MTKNAENINLKLWEAVEKTDPKYTKAFNNGNFSGTAINPVYLAKKATEQFGSMGAGWGIKELEHFIESGVWFSKVQLWYVLNDKKGEVEQWGATKFIYQVAPKDGKAGYTKVDEEAAKKAITDGMSKCLSLLGFSSDVYMGLYDDVKYVNEVKKEFAKESQPVSAKPAPTAYKPTQAPATDKPVGSMSQQELEALSDLELVNMALQYEPANPKIQKIAESFDKYHRIFRERGDKYPNSPCQLEQLIACIIKNRPQTSQEIVDDEIPEWAR
jgi:hypothetical protein